MKTRTNQPVVAEGTPDGTLNKVLGVDASGNIVKGEVSGGTQIYKHEITLGSYPTVNAKAVVNATNTIEDATITASYASKKLVLYTLDKDAYTTDIIPRLASVNFICGYATIGPGNNFVILFMTSNMLYVQPVGSMLAGKSLLNGSMDLFNNTITSDVVTPQ